MDNKVVVITGATSGIGFEMAKELCTQGFKVVLACRNLDQGLKVQEEFNNLYAKVDVDVMEINLASFSSIKRFAKKFRTKYNKLHVLINNAGVFCDTAKKTEDGFEMTMGVNYLGTFFLTELLLPIIIKTADARIVNITSKSAFYGKLKVDDNMFYSNVYGFKAYYASKLAQIFYTIDLSERLKDKGVTVNAACPGRVATKIWNGKTLMMKFLSPIITKKGSSPKEGASTGIFLATSPRVKDITGKMFFEKKVIDYSEVCLDNTIRREVVKLSYKVVKKYEENLSAG
ncbi:SDR family oxidoreductase [Proteinivorax tanatarense]|uniref:SDR family oxidoreductase n=1 Tax=Proteinivorax tanatarense TaxID=1260629 RepID=A0AAU7VM16_9FIRM